MRHLLFTAALLAGGLHAATIDFNSISGGVECTGLGGNFSTAGYTFSPGDYMACPGTPAGNSLRFSSNGTVTIRLAPDSGLVHEMARTDGAAFSLLALDFAQLLKFGDPFYVYNATNLEVRGFLGGNQVGSVTIAITAVSDGPGGMPDFRTATFSQFGNVDRIALTPFSSELYAYSMIDNIVVGAPGASPVPEPPSLALTGLAGVALSIVRRFRRS